MNMNSLSRGLVLAAAFVCVAISGPASAAGIAARPVAGALAQAQFSAPMEVQYYYPPPGYYAPVPRYYAPPPPAYYPPPRDLNRAYDPERDGPLGHPTQRGGANVPYSYMCYAGVYTCQSPTAAPVGSGCSCPGLGAPSYGQIR